MPPTQYQKRMMLVEMDFSDRVDIASPAMQPAAMSPNVKPSILLSLESLESSSLVILCVAIKTTILKQMTMEMISRGKIGSFSIRHAIIEIQNGLVSLNTITSEIGAKGAAIFNSKKLP